MKLQRNRFNITVIPKDNPNKFVPSMHKYIGTKIKVYSTEDGGYYGPFEDPWYWHPQWVELVDDRPLCCQI